MVRRETGCDPTLAGSEWRDTECGVCLCDGSAFVQAPSLNTSSRLNPLSRDVCGLGGKTQQAKGSKTSKSKADKKYLGVRVKMPVRDLLRNIRIANGIDPKDLQKKDNKDSKGDKKRVNMSGDRRNRLKKWQTKSLEELAFIVEVLEEDLKSSTTRQPNFLPVWCEDTNPHGPTSEPSSPPSCRSSVQNSPAQSVETYDYLPSDLSRASSPYSDIHDGYSSGEPDYYTDRSYCGNKWQTRSADGSLYHGPGMEHRWGSRLTDDGWDSVAYFWSQTERLEHHLNGVSVGELLAVDERGRTLLHRAVDEGKRALVYVIAKKMADLKRLESKDHAGKTALHLAAEKNQHLMVSDLISLGANVNERTNCEKTCLHLSAESGYFRVLEVLKSYMKSGIYVDLDARDVNGLSALQVASVSLKSIAGELERSVTTDTARLHSLRKEQMMETLKCLLQMECNLQSLKPAALTKHENNRLTPGDVNTRNKDVTLY